MTLTLLTVTASNGYTTATGQSGAGEVVLQPAHEATGGGYIVVSTPTTFTVTAGQIVAPNQIASNAQATTLQYLVYEKIRGAQNPPPYVVTPTGSTLDLSTAPRGTLNQTTPIYVLASTVGQPGGPGGPLREDGTMPPGQLPASTGTALWQVAETYAGLSNPDALTPYPDNDPDAGITLDSGTYENFDIICTELILPNDNTVLRNCRITTSNSVFGVRLDANTGLEVGRYLEHCQITAAGVALSGAGFTARLVEVVNNGDDSARIGRSHAEPTVLELCHFHDFRPAAGAHADGVQLLTLPAADLVILGCSVRMDVAAGYTVPPATGFTAAVFTDPADVAVPGDDPEPTRVGNVWVDGCLLFSADNFSLVVNGSPDGALPIGTDVRNSTLLPGTTAIAELNTTVTGANNVDGNGLPLADIGIHSDPRSRYLTVGDPRQSGGGFTPVINKVRFTSGDIAFPNTSGAMVPIQQGAGAGNALIEADVTAAVGHWVEIHVTDIRTTGAAAILDVGVMVGASVVRWLSSDTTTPAGDGLVSFYSDPANFTSHGDLAGFTVTSNDLDGGTVRLVLAVNSNGTQTLKCSAGNPVTLIAKNTGPHN